MPYLTIIEKIKLWIIEKLLQDFFYNNNESLIHFKKFDARIKKMTKEDKK